MSNNDLPVDITDNALFKQMLSDIMSDNRLYKRLRYTVALEKCGGTMTEKQGELLAADLIPHCKKYGLDETLMQRPDVLRKFYILMRKVAWERRDTVENFKLLKTVATMKKGD